MLFHYLESGKGIIVALNATTAKFKNIFQEQCTILKQNLASKIDKPRINN